jgi:nitric oxide reductase NorE protein
VLLITGSWCVARAVQAVRSDARSAGLRWLLARWLAAQALAW